MSSGQETRIERAEAEAEAAARGAAEGLASLRIERGGDRQEALHEYYSVKDSREDAAEQRRRRRGGILSSIRQGAKSVFGAVTGRTQETANQTRDTAGSDVKKIGEHKHSALDKAMEAKGTTSGDAGAIKDTPTAGNTPENMEMTAGTRQEHDYNHPLASSARRAIDYFTGKKEGARKWIAEAGESTPAKLGQTDESAIEAAAGRGEAEGGGEGGGGEAGGRGGEKESRGGTQRGGGEVYICVDLLVLYKLSFAHILHWFLDYNRGMSARENIYGAAGSLTDAMKQKMTMPTDRGGGAQEGRAKMRR